MKVKELTEFLAQCDPEMDVLIFRPNSLCEMAARPISTVNVSWVDAVPEEGNYGEVMAFEDDSGPHTYASVVLIATTPVGARSQKGGASCHG